jgi:hypothetical protein
MRRISRGLRVSGSAVIGLGVTSCASLSPGLERSLFGIAESDPAWTELIGKCHDAVLKVARPHGAVRVAFSDLGTPRAGGNDAIAAIFVTAVYLRQGGAEVRRASVECHLNDKGDVIALL